jgi:hypothetical protein
LVSRLDEVLKRARSAAATWFTASSTSFGVCHPKVTGSMNR